MKQASASRLIPRIALIKRPYKPYKPSKAARRFEYAIWAFIGILILIGLLGGR